MEFCVNVSFCLCSWLKTVSFCFVFRFYLLCLLFLLFPYASCMFLLRYLNYSGFGISDSDICIGNFLSAVPPYFLSFHRSSVLGHIFALSPIRATLLFLNKFIFQNSESVLPVHWYHLFVLIRYHSFFRFSRWNFVQTNDFVSV